MANTPDQFFLQAWKAQIDAGLRALETMTEGAIRMHEAQLEAATQAYADLEATRKAIAGASDASEVMKLCGEWARANAEKSFAYWRSLLQAGTPEAPPQMLNLGMLDSAYKQWMENMQRLYQVKA
jgi:Phasin protein